MPLAKLVHLAQKCFPETFLHYLSLIHLLLSDHVFHRVCLVIILHREEDFLLLAHLYQSFAIALLQEEVLGNLLFIEDKLLFLLHFELLNQLKCRSFIVSHILVPGVRKLLKLKFLCTFDINEFFFLSKAHVLFLSLLLSSGKFLESHFHHFGSCIISGSLCIDTELIHNSRKIKVDQS